MVGRVTVESRGHKTTFNSVQKHPKLTRENTFSFPFYRLGILILR